MARAKDRSAGGRSEPGRAPAGGRLLGLKVLVVVAGAVLMSMEIVGSRLLAPHFGNSVFVWGSLISVFLTALSLGYWVGGELADRAPRLAVLERICLGVAGLIFLVPWIGHPFANALTGAGLGEQSGPLVAAIVLFLPPSFLLGMVSPYSVRLAARDVTSIGRAAGVLYALSTMGSIAGTLLTTFVLIPHFGVGWILRGLGLAMVLVPLGLALTARGLPARERGGVVPAILVGTIGCLVPWSSVAGLRPDERVVLDEDTPYHNIQVVDFAGRVRQLRFDQYVESSIDLAPPHRTWSEYTDYFHLAFLLQPDLDRALFIGAGGGIGPRTFHEHSPTVVVDVVDVDERVLEIARELFWMPEDERVRTFARDGRMFLRSSEGGYDAILLDAFTIGGRIPFHLATREAFVLARERLAPGGVFIMNVNSAVAGPNADIFHSVGATLQRAFPHVQAFVAQWRADPRPHVSRNVIFVASSEPLPSAAEWAGRAAAFTPHSSVTTRNLQEAVADLLEPMPDLSRATLLTDEHAPIETMRF